MPSRDPLDTMMETFSMVSPTTTWSFLEAAARSDAAVGFGDAGDLRGGLGRAFGEEPVELLDRDAGGLAECSYGRAGAVGGVLGAHEVDDFPVLGGEFVDAEVFGELGCHDLGPLGGVFEAS